MIFNSKDHILVFTARMVPDSVTDMDQRSSRLSEHQDTAHSQQGWASVCRCSGKFIQITPNPCILQGWISGANHSKSCYLTGADLAGGSGAQATSHPPSTSLEANPDTYLYILWMLSYISQTFCGRIGCSASEPPPR